MPNIRPLNGKLMKKAQEDLGESFERINEDLKLLRDWLSKERHLKVRDDDQFLVAFLRGCKYSLEKTKEKIDYYYALRHGVPELYKNRFISDENLEIFRLGCFLHLPKPLSEDGPSIQISRYAYYDPNKYNFSDVFKVSTMLRDIQMLENDNTIIMGFIEIVDLKNINTNHIFQFNAAFIKKLSILGEKAWPYRIKGVHFINTPPIAEKILFISKKLMPEKLKQRFVLHKNYSSLYEHIPQNCLPKEYGGSNGTVDEILADWEKKLLSYTKYFEEEAQYGTNEKLRSHKLLNMDSLFGLDGSFKKLAID